jgi:hypothetical protein
MNRSMTAMACALVLSHVGCDKKDPTGTEPKLAPSASALSPSAAPSSDTKKFTIDAKGTSSIDMPAPKEHVKANTDAAAGTLDVDFADLTRSRGEVKVDLSTLTTTTSEDAGKNTAQTEQARCWLEVADCAEAKLADDVKKANRYAVYAIRSIESPSASDLAKVAPQKSGAGETRTVTLTTKGDLLIHGHKVEGRTADLEIEFRYSPGAAPDKPTSLHVTTKKPLEVILAEHDVKPRDPFGKIAKQSFHLLGTKVADTAQISLDFSALPQT